MVDNAPKDNNIKSIYICDRGYASYNDYAHIIENGQYFLIRVTDKKTEQLLGKSISDITTLDTSLERILSRSQSKKRRLYPERENEYRHISKEVTFDYITDENPEYIIPDVFDPRVADVVAKAVSDEAIRLGIARIK